MSNHGLLSLVTVGMFCQAITLGQSVSSVLDHLKERHAHLTKLEVEFSSQFYMFSDQYDPFDEDKWRKLKSEDASCYDYVGTIRSLAPHSFSAVLTTDCSAGRLRKSAYSWHNGELRSLAGLEEGRAVSGIRTTSHQRGMLLVNNVLTPLGFRFFGDVRTLPELAASAELEITDVSFPLITLTSKSNSEVTDYNLSLSVNESLGYMPVSIAYRKHNAKGHEELVCKVLESKLVDNVYLPKRAIYYVHNTFQPYYSLTDWRLVSARRDDAISAETLVVNFPPGTIVNDMIDHKQYVVGDSNERIKSRDMPQKLDEQLAANMAGVKKANALKASRRQVFPYIIGSAVAITAVLAAVQYLRKRGGA